MCDVLNKQGNLTCVFERWQYFYYYYKCYYLRALCVMNDLVFKEELYYYAWIQIQMVLMPNANGFFGRT